MASLGSFAGYLGEVLIKMWKGAWWGQKVSFTLGIY